MPAYYSLTSITTLKTKKHSTAVKERHTFSISPTIAMASTNKQVDDQWQVNSDTHGHNVVVIFKPTTALTQNITTAVPEIEHNIDVENLVEIAPFSFAELDLTRTPSINKVVEEYFASYYFKVRIIFHVEQHLGTDKGD